MTYNTKQGARDSNPDEKVWKLPCYRYISPLYSKSKVGRVGFEPTGLVEYAKVPR